VTNFQNSFTDRPGRKFTTKLSLKLQFHLKRVDTLPCEMLIFKNCADRGTETANWACRNWKNV